jgi:plastocyanin domain-containing protein
MKILSRFLPNSTTARATASQNSQSEGREVQNVRAVEIIVDGGYRPSAVVVTEGEHLELDFLRKDSSMCTREVVLPALRTRRDLPQNEPVIVYVPPLKPGEYEFHCGMNMVRGKLIVRPRAA